MHRRIAAPLFLTALFLFTAASVRAQLTPPSIVFGPTNQTVVQGGIARFQVSATGSSNLFYRWWKDGNPILLPPNRFLTISNVQPADAGAYHATVSNSVGTATSQVAILTVTVRPPLITSQPVGGNLCPNGSNAILSVTATGSLPLVYQWRLNGIDIPFAVTRTLTVPGSVANIGDYSVVITNSAGSVTSLVARLAPGILILDQPQTWHVLPGGTISLSIVAIGCAPVSYQWRRNAQPLPGAVQSALLITNAVAGDAGNYDCVVSDSYSSATSSVATITMLSGAPLITMQPSDRLDINDTNVAFNVGYSSIPLAFVQWQFNGVNIPGATNTLLSFRITSSSEGGYCAVVTNIYGAVTSRVATLTLRKFPPSLEPWTQPISQALCPGNFGNGLYVFPNYPAAFPPTFQWRLNGTNVPFANNNILYLHGRTEQAGDYTVVIANAFGAITSEVAHVTLPRFASEPQDVQVRDGDWAFFACTVDLCGPYSTQWQKDDAPIPGATFINLGFNPARASDAGDYRLVVTHAFGMMTSAVARLTVEQVPPSVATTTPEDQSVYAGHWAQLSIIYDPGAPECNVQWYRNGRPIPGETSPNLDVFAASAADQGRYYVVLSNIVGVVTSRVARLTVLFSPPFFEQEPEDYTVEAGGTAYFFAQASGAPPPAFQWLRDGVAIPGETNDSLAVAILSTNHIAGYSVIASNLLGSITSQVARVQTLLYPPGIVIEPSDQFLTAGQWATFASVITSAPPAELQWYLNGQAIPGATNYFLQFRAGFSNQMGGYHIVARNELGAVTSRVATLTITLIGPQIYTQPAPQSVVEGEALAIYGYEGSGIPALTQWQRDGIDIPGATSPSLFIRYAETNHAGDYRVIFRNDAGAVTSQVARIEVRPIGPLEKWHWRRPLPQGDHLIAVAHGNGRHVSVGYNRGVAVSTNAQDWFDTRHPTKSGYRYSISYGNGVFVANANAPGSVLQHSTNGADWIDWDMPPELGASAAVFGNGRFVARATESSSGTVIRNGVVVSTNGVDWEFQHTTGSPWVDYLFNLQFVHDRFLATAQGAGLNGQMLHVSEDGVHWSETGLFLPYGTLLPAHDGQRFVGRMSGYNVLFVSTNGLHWSTESATLPDSYPNFLTFGNGVWVTGGFRNTAGTATLQWSTDTSNWTDAPGVGTNGVTSVIFDGTRFVAVGYYGFMGTSTNGRDWHVINPGTDVNLRSITRADGLFVAVGGGGRIYTSRDGRDWAARDSGTALNLRSVTRFKDHFIAVGEQDFAGGPSTIRISQDGVNWLPLLTGAFPKGNLYSLAHNGSRIVAVGDFGNVSVSSDGLNWSNLVSGVLNGPNAVIPTSADLNAVTWTGDRFSAVGKDGNVISSFDGFSWWYSGPGGGRNLHGIAYGNGVHVIVANSGRTFHSTNGTNWIRVDLPGGSDFSDVQFANGRFIAVGDNGTVYTSTNGAVWTRHPTACANDLRSVLYADGSYYAVGNNETILQSAQVDAHLRGIPNAGGGLPAIAILGEIGRSYRLQGSSDLREWFDIQTVTISSDRRIILPTPPAFTSTRFFRLVSP